MPLVEWDQSFSVNHNEIDQQHKRWIEILNQLHDDLVNGSFDDLNKMTINALKSMQEYANNHFEFEEQYLREIGYPKLVEHHRLHKDFDDNIYRYDNDIRQGHTVLNTEIITVLKDWLINHIQGADKDYCKYAASNNA